MKKKYLGLITLMSVFTANFAQENNDKKYSLISATDNSGISILSLTDPYLSPLSYNGFGISYEHSERKYFNPENINLSMKNKIGALVGITTNQAYSSQISYTGFSYSWGVFYHYRKLKNLTILAGGNAEGQLAIKTNSRNVNNPVNPDMSININLDATLRYDLKLKNKTLHLSYNLETPVLGCMYVPLIGASYYEMFELGELDKTFHFSSIHNRSSLKSMLSIDIPLKRTTLSFGLANQSLAYKANNMVFKYSLSTFQFGIKYDFYIFKGKNDSAPSIFVSTDK